GKTPIGDEVVQQPFVRLSDGYDGNLTSVDLYVSGKKSRAVGTLPAIGIPAVGTDPKGAIFNSCRAFDIRLQRRAGNLQKLVQIKFLDWRTSLVTPIKPELVF